jgi:tetratricopeptide (TPR) repeat protein
MTASASAIDAALAAAEADLSSGRLQPALIAARAASGEDTPQPQRTEALRLRALSAFRLGELDEAADAAQTLLDQLGDQAITYPARIPVLSVSVVAAGELARFDQALGHLQQVLSAASRSGSFEDFVRARGTAATCFALLGDPWAGQRLLSELLGMFQGLPSEAMLEAATRNNHVAVCLRIARLARDAGDEAGFSEALDHAEASLERSTEIARLTGDARLAAFVDIYASETAPLRGDTAAAVIRLQGAIESADAAGLQAHSRFLRVIQAETLNASAEPERALALLREVDATLHEGHELDLRIRCAQQLQRACVALGAHAEALQHAARGRQIEQTLLYKQSRAQSQYLRTRLELEHLYRYRASASRSISSRPGQLTEPAPLDTNPAPKR